MGSPLTERGLTGAERGSVSSLVLGAWAGFLAVAEGADLDRATRLPGWRAHEVCTHLGVWDDYDAVAGLIASARDGGAGGAPDVDAANARVTQLHRQAPRGAVLEALRRHRDGVRHYLEGPAGLDLAPTAGPVGTLPLLTTIVGEAYELAVHALDLHDAGAGEVPPALLDAGLAALAEVTGALAAQHGVTGGATLATPEGGWRFTADNHGWQVERTPAQRGLEGAGVRGEAAVLLEASSGRTNPVGLLARRRLTLHDPVGLLALAPLVEVAPNLPGGPLLRTAARSLSEAAGLLTRLRR